VSVEVTPSGILLDYTGEDQIVRVGLVLTDEEAAQMEGVDIGARCARAFRKYMMNYLLDNYSY